MEGLPVSYSLNSGDNGNNWWGDFIGAAIGGAAGAERIMPELILDAAEVVENPPKTWDKYLKEGKTADIIRMEGKEFMTAIEKAESVEHFLKEATHTLAAVMLFCAEK